MYYDVTSNYIITSLHYEILNIDMDILPYAMKWQLTQPGITTLQLKYICIKLISIKPKHCPWREALNGHDRI